MFIAFDHRASDSPLVERVWRSQSARAGSFYSMAEPNIEIVVARVAGRRQVVLRGPVTRASLVDCPPHGEWLGIRLRVGAHLRGVATSELSDHRSLILPSDARGIFWLADRSWEIPTFDTAESLVSKLTVAGVIGFESVVEQAAERRKSEVALRSIQRRFLRATGLTRVLLRQIERARQAAFLLGAGAAALDVVDRLGYFDQPHLTRALRRLVGPTPGGLLRAEDQLSFLYNTTPSLEP